MEVIVVDNASADGSRAMVGDRFPWIRLIDNAENVGFARACNQAIRISDGRYILMLNSDTEIASGAIQALVRFVEEHPRVGAAGARIINPDGSLQRSCFRAPSLSRELWRLLHLDVFYSYAEYSVQHWDQAQPKPVDSVLGACFLVRRAALDQVGLLDEQFFIYSEEVDLCTRLRSAGWSVYWVPQATVMHRGAESTRQVAAAMFLRLYQGKVLYFRKHRGQLGACLYKLILAIAAAARLVLSPAAWFERSAVRERHLALAGHYGRLLRALPWM